MNFILIGTILKIVGEAAICAGGAVMMRETSAKVTKKLVEKWIEDTNEEAEKLTKGKEEKG